MRYTEARLAEDYPGSMSLADLDKNIVDFVPNFDETEKEPVCSSGAYPESSGKRWYSEGIAVGMATSIPTHNLGEVVDAVKAYMKNEEITTRQLMKYIKDRISRQEESLSTKMTCEDLRDRNRKDQDPWKSGSRR